MGRIKLGDNVMKKRFTIILIVFLGALVFSFGSNIRNVSEQSEIKRAMLNHVFTELVGIYRGLDSLIYSIENEEADAKTIQQSLIMLSRNFTRLDAILRWYATSFRPRGVSRNHYTGVINFDFISSTLTASRFAINDILYYGVMESCVMSENEILYLSILRDDISVIIASMASDENPLLENQNLTVYQMDNILNVFFSRWSFHYENSPFFLLRSE